MEYVPSEGWDYDKHPERLTVGDNCKLVKARFSTDADDRNAFLVDTRPVHGEIFTDTTPARHEYFAGNYRGALYQHLKEYNVEIFESKGTPAQLVNEYMEKFSEELQVLLSHFIKSTKANENLPVTHKVIRYSRLLAYIFVKFLAIHPYANGNGHIARLIVWVLLQKEGLPTTFWSVDRRPDRPLFDCIVHFRRQNFEPLVEYFHYGILSGDIVTFEKINVQPITRS